MILLLALLFIKELAFNSVEAVDWLDHLSTIIYGLLLISYTVGGFTFMLILTVIWEGREYYYYGKAVNNEP